MKRSLKCYLSLLLTLLIIASSITVFAQEQDVDPREILAQLEAIDFGREISFTLLEPEEIASNM